MFDPKDWQAVMPWIAPKDNLEQCIASMGDIPIPLLIVDNSPLSETKTMTFPGNVEVVYHPENLGFARSWNLGVSRRTKWTLIMSASLRFGGRFADFISGASKRANEYGLNPRMALHLYVLGKAVIDEIGPVDERWVPGYFEDNDLFRRMILSGITGCGTSELPYYHPEYVTCIGDAIALKSGAIRVDFVKNERQYVDKWGGTPGHETFDHPFNRPDFPLSYVGNSPNDN